MRGTQCGSCRRLVSLRVPQFSRGSRRSSALVQIIWGSSRCFECKEQVTRHTQSFASQPQPVSLTSLTWRPRLLSLFARSRPLRRLPPSSPPFPRPSKPAQVRPSLNDQFRVITFIFSKYLMALCPPAILAPSASSLLPGGLPALPGTLSSFE